MELQRTGTFRRRKPYVKMMFSEFFYVLLSLWKAT